MKRFIATLLLLGALIGSIQIFYAPTADAATDTFLKRATGRNDDGSVMGDTGLQDPTRPKIQVHILYAVLEAWVFEAITTPQIQTLLKMNADDITSATEVFSTLVGGPSGASDIDKLKFLAKMHAIFILAECRCLLGVTTIAELRTRLGI